MYICWYKGTPIDDDHLVSKSWHTHNQCKFLSYEIVGHVNLFPD
jgi:hypothetical protein